MLKERAYSYFIDKNKNCSETTLLSISDEYGLGLTEADMVLVSGFGGGIGCGALCGVAAGCVAALGKMTITGCAHATEGFGDVCAALHKRLDTELGGTQCATLKPMYRTDTERCLKAVEKGLTIFEAFVKEHNLMK